MKLDSDDPGLAEDPGYCGLGIETGKWDPFWQRVCYRHDRRFNQHIAGVKGAGAWVTARDMFVDSFAVAGEQLGKGIYATVMALPYALIGSVGGLVRWQQITLRKRKEDAKQTR